MPFFGFAAKLLELAPECSAAPLLGAAPNCYDGAINSGRGPSRAITLREALMKLAYLVTAASVAVMLSAQPGLAQTKSGVDKLYILDCGQGVGPDQSRWSPGVNVGKPLAVSDNCYLIHHTQGWFLWDTGVADAIAAMPDGQKGEGTGPAWKRPKTLISQLDQLGVKPSDIK